jgi:hypothetical protein
MVTSHDQARYRGIPFSTRRRCGAIDVMTPKHPDIRQRAED